MPSPPWWTVEHLRTFTALHGDATLMHMWCSLLKIHRTQWEPPHPSKLSTKILTYFLTYISARVLGTGIAVWLHRGHLLCFRRIKNPSWSATHIWKHKARVTWFCLSDGHRNIRYFHVSPLNEDVPFLSNCVRAVESLAHRLPHIEYLWAKSFVHTAMSWKYHIMHIGQSRWSCRAPVFSVC